ncbi:MULTISPECIES: paraquat-inducible protein A [unclassified Pseudomonas]|jgi:paraquat-inducible protein A|uniref:paraquat-inducible protein A n=1 Tax=unclassified Pseudomonas TaxID=196821 RepID=UPI0003F99DE6|nr:MULTISPECIES: paraquat-inducible protein A [unclassified Pseudomonas]ATP44644.1 paraquat-inducible protein A [Pseudomonas putida]SMF48090.1 paraquat-inducible protein A [Pseudomonas sp. LAIL14HWK12:I11]SMR73853.1 paraquat-inducible protein A [Pseudomonas sp. LAIL14HWK12:I10]SOD05979.1 paraquat-inducible protein A [Pseudomonas sp. LAIL14HWK12:I8]GLO58467.1 paraquat-inducible protein A [Pseudomonas putida]
MAQADDVIICEYCDAVYRRTPLHRHQSACCQRCGGVLYRHNPLNVQQRLALCITGGVLLVFANAYPVMTISMSGLSNSATLWDSVQILSHGSITFIALVLALSIIFAPVLQIALLCWVLGFALGRRRAPGFAACMRALEGLRPWSMLEVCLLGAMVAVIKLAGLLEVIPGIGLIALAALSVLMIFIAGRDIRDLWVQV